MRQTCAIVISLWLLPVWRLSHESETVPLKCVSWQALGEYVRRIRFTRDPNDLKEESVAEVTQEVSRSKNVLGLLEGHGV